MSVVKDVEILHFIFSNEVPWNKNNERQSKKIGMLQVKPF